MAIFAAEVVSHISHLLPTEQEIDRFFTEDSLVEDEVGGEDEDFEFSVPLEQEHLEALESYIGLVNDEAFYPDDTPTRLYHFLHEMSEESCPFGFWYHCCQSAINRDFPLAFIMYMMSNEAISPLESFHAFFSTALEAVNGIFEFEEDAYELLTSAMTVSKERLVCYVPISHQIVADALLDSYLLVIDRGDEEMDQQLFAIEAVYLKLISNN